MSFKIAIASGKGGTGKTTVAISLYHFLGKNGISRISLMDCDVEEPNDGIFFPDASLVKEEEVFQDIPVIDNEKCTFCRRCAEYCEFNAIVVIPPAKYAEINASLCHSCGACIVACQEKAITEKKEPIGKIKSARVEKTMHLLEGRLKIGSALQTMLIKEVKKHSPEDDDITLYDAPPGTSCPVVETIHDADYVILVSEPTLFGLHDLKLMVDLMKETNKKFGVIINKAGLGDQSLYEYLNAKRIEILGEIPFNQDYASQYAKGDLLNNIPNGIANSYRAIAESLELRRSRRNERDHDS